MPIEKRNIFLSDTADTFNYTSPGSMGKSSYPIRNVESHARYIQNKLKKSYERSDSQRQAAAIRYKDGVYLEFEGAAEHDLAIASLENLKQGIRLLNVKKDNEEKKFKATVYIPKGEEAYFLEKVDAYANEQTVKGNPKNNDLVSSIEDVRLALVESFWIGSTKNMPKENPVWCEIWLWFTQGLKNPNVWQEIHEEFKEKCIELQISTDPHYILFPERLVKIALVNKKQLQNLIDTCAHIAEVRRAPESISFFDQLSNTEQKEWTENILERVRFIDSDTSICILDTGLTEEHDLLKSAVQDEGVHAIKSEWGTGDHQGHGTEMAGIAIYNNLEEALVTKEEIVVPHKLESVKIVPPRGENPPELYGAITEQAVSIAEISNPTLNRVLCMAVTSEEYNTEDGSPTSWSAAVDSITSGANELGEKRLFIVSAGNVSPVELYSIEYPKSSVLHKVENPGQAWNALTVGASNNAISIAEEGFHGFTPVADVGELSPYSSTSRLWGQKWPIKPEILLDGGNMSTNGEDYTEATELSSLTTGYRPLVKNFSTIWGTSASAARAAWMAAQLTAEYPNAWPETIRALLVHSASWTDKMKEQFCKDDKKTTGRRNLLRMCGYGIPDLSKAIQCMNNQVNLVIQGELQPFEGKSMKDMHLHKLPWPKEQLLNLGDTLAKLKVTLSYFVEPGPGEIGWKDKYRYPSCGLRFDVINSDESVEDFKKRINVKMRGEDKKDNGAGTSGSEKWYLGSDSRDVGSVHSDFRETTAADLSEAGFLAVYPVVGWWRERGYLGKSNSKIRYSLVVSIETPEVNTDLYTSIITEIKTSTQVIIPT